MAAIRTPCTKASPYGCILWLHPHSSVLRMKFIVLITSCLLASLMSHASELSDKLKTRVTDRHYGARHDRHLGATFLSNLGLFEWG